MQHTLDSHPITHTILLSYLSDSINYPIILAAPKPGTRIICLRRKSKRHGFWQFIGFGKGKTLGYQDRSKPYPPNTAQTLTFALNNVPTVVDPQPTVSVSGSVSRGTGSAAELGAATVEPNCGKTQQNFVRISY